MSNQALFSDRAEDLRSEDLPTYFKSTKYEQELIEKLKDHSTYLLDGCRGSGKTMLMRVAEFELDGAFRTSEGASKALAVFVRFPRAIALEGAESAAEQDYHPFRQWVFAKLLKGTIEKLSELGGKNVADMVLSIVDTEATVTAKSLGAYIDRLETAYNDASALRPDLNAPVVGISAALLRHVDKPDVMREQLVKVIRDFGLDRIVFMLDEVAQNLSNEHQSEFFSVVKHLRDARIVCKVAVYPHITSYGRDFEVGQDAISLSIERPVENDEYYDFFKDIVEQRLSETPLANALSEQPDYLKLLVKACFGNPRALIHILARLPVSGTLQSYEVLGAIKDYVDTEHLKYLRNLKDRLRHVQPVVSLAEDLLGQFVEDLKKLNTKPGPRYLFVAVSSQKAVPYRIHKAIDILLYAGLLARRGTVKITSRESAVRYLVNLGVLIKENAVADPQGRRTTISPKEMLERLTSPDRDRKKEYTRNSPDLLQLSQRSEEDERQLSCIKCGRVVRQEDRFCANCGTKLERSPLYAELLSHDISRLDLTPGVLKILQEDGRLRTVGDIIRATDKELDGIYKVGHVRTRLIRYAAEEYISG